MMIRIKKRYVNGTAFPYSIETHNGDAMSYEIVEWCAETFGKLNSGNIYSENGKWLYTGRTIRFKSEADYNWLLLRWGSEHV
jgi:hypothetical protein